MNDVVVMCVFAGWHDAAGIAKRTEIDIDAIQTSVAATRQNCTTAITDHLDVKQLGETGLKQLQLLHEQQHRNILILLGSATQKYINFSMWAET